jgi:hypothetical protein
VPEAHGWLADPWCVLITWLTLDIPPKRVTIAPTH